jgi:hypothetical protein
MSSKQSDYPLIAVEIRSHPCQSLFDPGAVPPFVRQIALKQRTGLRQDIGPLECLAVRLVGVVLIGFHGLENAFIAGNVADDDLALRQNGFEVGFGRRHLAKIAYDATQFLDMALVIAHEFTEPITDGAIVDPFNGGFVCGDGIEVELDQIAERFDEGFLISD